MTDDAPTEVECEACAPQDGRLTVVLETMADFLGWYHCLARLVQDGPRAYVDARQEYAGKYRHGSVVCEICWDSKTMGPRNFNDFKQWCDHTVSKGHLKNLRELFRLYPDPTTEVEVLRREMWRKRIGPPVSRLNALAPHFLPGAPFFTNFAIAR